MSRFTFEPMTEEHAEEIIRWHYEGLYSFYDMKADEDDIVDFLDSDNWGRVYFAVKEGQVLIGYFAYTFKNEILWIGMGLKPRLTGCGMGLQFVKEGIEHGVKAFNYQGKCIKLAIAAMHKPAIHVFEQAGFRKYATFYEKTTGTEFICMELVVLNTGD